jgi:hypothetical protein
MSGIGGLNPNRIPGTDYEIHGTKDGGTVFTKDGKEISQDEFLSKVDKKEISLSQNSLRFLDSWLGPDSMQSLRTSTGFPSSPGELSGKLGTSDQFLGDLYSLMEILEKTVQDQKKQMNDVKQTEQQSNLQAMTDSAQKEWEAAQTRAVWGFVSAGVTIGAGVVSVVGSSLQLAKSGEGMKLGNESSKLLKEGTKLSEEGAKLTEKGSELGEKGLDMVKKGTDLTNKGAKLVEDSDRLSKVSDRLLGQQDRISRVFSGVTSTMEGGSKALDTAGGVHSSSIERESKMKDIEAKKEDQKVEETKNNIDTLRDMHNKVKELLQAIQDAEDRSSQSVNRM